MKGDLKLKQISKDSITDVCDRYCVDERNEIYFLSYETEPEERMSVLFSDLKWLRKHYGVEKFNEKCIITKESLNNNRKKTINDLKKCIELNIHERSIEYLQEDGSFGLINNPNYGKPFEGENTFGIDLRKEIPRKPDVLTKTLKERYKKDIDRGLYILCKYV